MLITFFVFIGPFIYDVDQNAINFRERNLDYHGPALLGTDNIGQTPWPKCLPVEEKFRMALAVGFLAVVSLLIGSLIGVLAGSASNPWMVP